MRIKRHSPVARPVTRKRRRVVSLVRVRLSQRQSAAAVGQRFASQSTRVRPTLRDAGLNAKYDDGMRAARTD